MFETFENLLEAIAGEFDYVLHPSQSILIVRGEEVAVVYPKGDHGGTISYRKDGLEFRRVSGRLEHIRKDLENWKERVS